MAWPVSAEPRLPDSVRAKVSVMRLLPAVPVIWPDAEPAVVDAPAAEPLTARRPVAEASVAPEEVAKPWWPTRPAAAAEVLAEPEAALTGEPLMAPAAAPP